MLRILIFLFQSSPTTASSGMQRPLVPISQLSSQDGKVCSGWRSQQTALALSASLFVTRDTLRTLTSPLDTDPDSLGLFRSERKLRILFHSRQPHRNALASVSKRLLVWYMRELLRPTSENTKLFTMIPPVQPYWYQLKSDLSTEQFAPKFRVPTYQFLHNWNSYDQGECSVIFADTEVGGGTFRAGTSQEEMAMLQCFNAALFTAYAREIHDILMFEESDRADAKRENSNFKIRPNEVIFMENVRKRFILPQQLGPVFVLQDDKGQDLTSVERYRDSTQDIGSLQMVRRVHLSGGGGFRDHPLGRVEDTVTLTPQDVHNRKGAFLLMDAVNKRGQSNELTEAEVSFMLQKAMLGFSVARSRGYNRVSTGSWGTGDFNVNLFVSLSVQMVAAYLVGLDGLVFYGVNETDVHTKRIIDACRDVIAFMDHIDHQFPFGGVVRSIVNVQAELFKDGRLKRK